ncbi:hypothetical protein WP5S18E01_23820 [Enterobacter cloacae]|nr:hypothetical protein WP5S18E01_23820 [Enterobacter cloacae]
MKQITISDLKHQSEQAANSPRLRAHRNFHTDLSDPVQRLAITMEPGTAVLMKWYAQVQVGDGGFTL